MSKYNHNKKTRRNRKWLANVGDGAKLTREGNNPNDAKK
jgi:hypothetical protein